MSKLSGISVQKMKQSEKWKYLSTTRVSEILVKQIRVNQGVGVL